MPLITCGLPNMTATSGGTTTNAVGNLDDAWGLTVFSPGTLTSTGVTVQVEPTSTGTNFVVLQSGGSDVQFIAGRATVISPVPFKQVRLVCSAAEGATRTFTITKAILT